MKAPLTLIVSDRMDDNKKEDRYEDRLIRMGENARKHLGLKDEKTVELWPDGPVDARITRSKVLEIFQAYSSDLKKAKTHTSEEDYNRIGFVTSRTFNYICKDKRRKKRNTWIADTIEDTVIGADPEFILKNSDGTIKYAAEVAGFHHADKLGSDGPWAEVRPDPAVDVSDLIHNIEDILNNHENAKLIQEYQWLSGCYYYGRTEGGNERSWPIGGHIHIGTPARLARAIDSFGNNYKTAVYACLNKVLDEYVAIPTIKIDGVENACNRRKEFGSYGDVRTDHRRLEYRTLSGEWLTHPEMAKIIVGTVKAIAHEFFKLLDEADYKHSMIMTQKQQSSDNHTDFRFFDSNFHYWTNIEITKALNAVEGSKLMYDILNNGAIDFNKPFFTALKKKFRSLSVYKSYSEYLDQFIELVSLPVGILEKRDKDLKHTWIEDGEFIL